jgi:hypothetical protein
MFFDEVQKELQHFRVRGEANPSGSSDGAKRKTTALPGDLNSISRSGNIHRGHRWSN